MGESTPYSCGQSCRFAFPAFPSLRWEMAKANPSKQAWKSTHTAWEGIPSFPAPFRQVRGLKPRTCLLQHCALRPMAVCLVGWFSLFGVVGLSWPVGWLQIPFLPHRFYFNRKTEESLFDDPRHTTYHSLYTRIRPACFEKQGCFCRSVAFLFFACGFLTQRDQPHKSLIGLIWMVGVLCTLSHCAFGRRLV